MELCSPPAWFLSLCPGTCAVNVRVGVGALSVLASRKQHAALHRKRGCWSEICMFLNGRGAREVGAHEGIAIQNG
jgi:hypothetical protein